MKRGDAITHRVLPAVFILFIAASWFASTSADDGDQCWAACSPQGSCTDQCLDNERHVWTTCGEYADINGVPREYICSP